MPQGQYNQVQNLIGKSVSHYRIIEKIGQGGMGEVFLADDASLQRKVALKFLPPDLQKDAIARKRFLREARSAAALKAVELDDTLAGTHGVRGDVFAWTDFDFPAADREYKRDLELDPKDAGSRAAYSHILMIIGRRDEAMQQIERAVAMDPLAEGLRLYHAVVLLGARRYDDALSQARLAGSGLAVRAQPGNLPALGVLVVAAHMKQQYAEAIAAGAAGYEGIGGRTSPRCSRRATPNRTTPARCDRLPRWNWRSMEGSQA
jgi:tetratricopeptide (TPR) repeat protein